MQLDPNVAYLRILGAGFFLFWKDSAPDEKEKFQFLSE